MYSKCTSEVCSSTYAYAVVQTRAEFSTELHAYFQIVTRQPTPGKKKRNFSVVRKELMSFPVWMEPSN